MGCKDIGIRKSEFVEMNQFLNVDGQWTFICCKKCFKSESSYGKHNERIFYTFKFKYFFEKNYVEF